MDDWQPGDPSREEIAEACLAIQSSWPPCERQKRAAWLHERSRFKVPVIRTSGDRVLRDLSEPEE